ncbi:hypothetical protein PLESTB_001555700 [Pleodorina starrii]|uniref:Uncharacterized protein n=1 Tax=Pleodorina starrii TaxID=330485 RepID=A0A9W6BY68_9CHLO|nr:hypothetical protein PLESTM_001471600 [Pleodorina starrii]GLC59935.1 hypothetical protein PLESTB_001555700 [Pleodorina starrii]GLC72840.1 hypothetical protein PLESTF_001298700 [Pleodorina starrii]
MSMLRASDRTMPAWRLFSAHGAAALCILLTYAAASSSPSLTAEFYGNLVSQPSRLARSVTKHGMVPIDLWDDPSFNFEPFHNWVLNSSVYRRNVSRNYPMSYPCGVWVNHNYKFIFIRNRKAASTTVTDNFDKCHYQGADPKLCIEVASKKSLAARGVDPAAMWRDYFVFTTSRNPWARAGSSYDYCSTKWARTEGPCRQPPFSFFARDPSILGKISNLFHCFDKVGMYHDYYHTEPVAPCITTAEGLPALDYVIRYENLSSDLPEAVELINKRRDPSLPPIPQPQIYWKKKGQAARAHEESGIDSQQAALVGHGAKYHQCGMQCVRDIYEYFRVDFELFQIPLPASAPGGGN